MASLLLVVVLLSMLFVLRKMDRLRKEKEGADAANTTELISKAKEKRLV